MPSGTVNKKVRVGKAQGKVSEVAVKVEMLVNCRFKESFTGLSWVRQDVLCIGGGLELRLFTDSHLF